MRRRCNSHPSHLELWMVRDTDVGVSREKEILEGGEANMFYRCNNEVLS